MVSKCLFFRKTIVSLQPSYLQEYLSSCNNKRTYFTRSSIQKKIKIFFCELNHLKHFFFSSFAKAWSKLGEDIKNVDSVDKRKSNNALNFTRPRENSVFAIVDIDGVKLLTSLRLNFRHLSKHKF